MRRFIAILMTLCMVLGMSSVSVWAAEAEGWQRETTMPTTVTEFGSCTIGNDIYILGGSTSNLVQKYSTVKKTWEMGTPMPQINDFTEAVAIGSNIYVIDADIMQIYDTKLKEWTVINGIPDMEKGKSIVAIKDKIYVENKGRIAIYDTTTDTWTNSSVYKDRDRVQYSDVCTHGDDIYVVGGNGPYNMFNEVQVYNIKTDTWRKASSFPESFYNSGITAIGDKIYILGGEEYSTFRDKVYVYDIETGSWALGPKFSINRKSCRAEVVNGKIYAIGGVNRPNGVLGTIDVLRVGEEAPVNSFVLSVLLNIGETVQLSTSFDLSNNQNFTWTSTNQAVATVDSNGKVTAVGVGDADIYAENVDGTFKEYIPVKVVEGIADELRLAVHLKVGEKAKLYLTDDPSQVTWSSLDESIATVSADGQVTGVKKGLAIVKAELDGETYQIYVRVNG